MKIIEILKVILFGIVEGITEWLPISSTGHMILLEEFVNLNVTEEFWKLFLVVIQLGAILAVVYYFFSKLNPFSKTKNEEEKKETWRLWFKVAIACVPAAIIGFILDDFLDKHLYNFLTVSLMLIVYGILFILIEIFRKNKETKVEDVKQITYKTALIIGFVQLLALIPGTSRSGVTILGAMMLGCSRTTSAEFSFFLSIPVMVGASLFKGLKFYINFGLPSGNELVLLGIGMIVAFLVSMLVIKFLMNFIKKRDFKIFGWYRIILGIILLAYFFIN